VRSSGAPVSSAAGSPRRFAPRRPLNANVGRHRNMSRSTVVLICLGLGLLLWAVLFGGRLPVPFRWRSCQGPGWRRSFPEAPKHEIRQFLSLFVSAFAFDDVEKLKLNPNDQILDIYRSLYPHKWLADNLELETLVDDLETKYGISLQAIWNERLTLGELFLRTRHTAVAT